MKTSAQDFLSLLFLSRNVAHAAHLNSDSYSEHVALGGFYDGIIDLADKFAEAWMGRNLKKIGDIPEMTSPKSDILKTLKVHLEIIEETRDFVPEKDSALNNIIDEIVELYLSTIYKLKFLR